MSSSSSSSRDRSESPAIADKDLMTLSVRELNKHLKSSKLTKNQVQLMKQRRRTLKNRRYAASCRNKRFQKKGELEILRQEELRQIEHLKQEIDMLQRSINEFEKKLGECIEFARKHKVHLELLSSDLQQSQATESNLELCL